MSPYVITVAEREDCPDCNGDPWSRTIATGEQGCESCSNRGWYLLPVSEQAVATVDEAQSAVAAVLVEHGERPGVAPALPEHGGALSPLPDGTLISVRRERWVDLAACANVRWEDTPECRAMVLERFNAQELVA